MLNKVMLMGNLCHSPELKKTSSNLSVLSFSVAVNRDYDREQVDFINCVAWRQTAEFISKYFDKGNLILIEGELQTRKYTDDNDVTRYVTEVNVSQVRFCGGNKKNSDFAPVNSEDDLPFNFNEK